MAVDLWILADMGIDESTLSNYQRSLAYSAQRKLFNQMLKFDRAMEIAIADLYARGLELSTIYTDKIEKMNQDFMEYQYALEEELGFQLEYLGASDGGGEGDGYSYPENPDYSLSAADRYQVVKNYYMSMSDPNVRFALFQADSIAPDYLGSFYATLYERLRSYTL